ncbi:pro-neuregulin-1, membrane-bound isoform isoform X2 [Genypterus blacodes]|uniref:pro-neuregulin-1, membrane-bound isoform isoform X2 n=1 Tax=Genypterus blacodes TaxID=154954 RepID=UPI003F757461
MTEGMEDSSAGPDVTPASPTGSTVDTGQAPEEKQEETVTGGEGGEGVAEGDGGGGGEHSGTLGIVALPGICCVCIEREQINHCLHSEKICILPILACLLSLALCTAGLKWVFVDKIFEYEPPTHLDAKRIGQDPFNTSVDPTLGLTVSFPPPSSSSTPLTTPVDTTTGRPEVFVKGKSTRGPFVPQSAGVTQFNPSVTLKYNADQPTIQKQTPYPQTTVELNDIIIPTISATSTTTTAKTSSHVTRCSDSQKNYCVNGGECFTLEVMPGSTKFLCRCLAGNTGHRCQETVLKTVSNPKPEELYQKRVLTITGICIALLVVGIMCVVAYCKTKKQRQKLHDRLRQSLRNKRKKLANATAAPQISNLPLQDLQLIDQCNGMSMECVPEKETSLSTSKHASSTHDTTTLNHSSSQRCRCVSPLKTPTRLSPVSRASATTPGSPPSEMSAPLSSLAISVPSVVASPSGEEERPLLLAVRRQLHRSSGREDHKRTSAHYNHGLEVHSLPPSPQFTKAKDDYQLTGDHDYMTTADAYVVLASPLKLVNSNNNNDYRTKISGVNNGHVSHNLQSKGDSEKEEEPHREDVPFLSIDSSAALLLRAIDSSRTNPASPDDDLQVRSSSATTKQVPLAV